MAVSLSEENGEGEKDARNISYIVCWAVLAVLVIFLVPLLLHKCQRPCIFGLYSKSYCAIILSHFFAIGLTLLAFKRANRERIDIIHLAKSYGFWFWLIVWLLVILATISIHWVTGDIDFQEMAYAIVGGGACIWWVLIYFARRLAQVLTNTALACTAAILTFVVAEVILAIFPIVSGSTETLRSQKVKLCQYERAARSGREWYQSILIADPELGYRIRPNFTMLQKRPSDSTIVETKTDSDGFLNYDYDSSHPCDVACVGDSFVAPPWPNILQSITGLKVAGFGVPAYSPPQYTIVVGRYAVKMKPKVLFYCIYVNDAVESVGYDDWKKSGMDWFTFKGSAWFGFSSGHTGQLFVRECLLRFSRIYTLLDFSAFRRTSERMPITAHPISYKTAKFNLVFDRGSFTVLTDMKNDAVKRGITLIRDSLEQANRFCRQTNVQMIVLLLPPKELVHYEALKERTTADDPIENLPEFYMALQKTCDDLYLECHDVTQRFREEAAKTGKALYGEVDIHWDEDGMKLMAQIASEILAQSGAFRDRIQ